MTVTRLKPRLRVVEQEPPSYKDFLRKRYPDGWQRFEPVAKQPGDLIVTSTKVEVQP